MQPLVQWKSNKCYIVWVCVCSLKYSVRNAHAPYCHLWSSPLRNIFLHFVITGTIFFFKKSYWTQNVCFDFLYNFWSETFLILRSNERDMIEKCILVYTLSTGYYCAILMKLEVPRQFKKILKNQISWKSVHWEQSCFMRTDGQTWRS